MIDLLAYFIRIQHNTTAVMIRKFTASVALFAILGFCLAAVPLIKIPKLTEQLGIVLGGPAYPTAVSEDLMAITIRNNAGYYVSVRRRGLDGMYNEISAIAESTPAPYIKGEWVVILNTDTTAKWNFYKIGTEGLNQSLEASSYSTAGFFSGFLVGESQAIVNGWEIYAYTNNKWAYTGTTVYVDNHVISSYSNSMTQDGKFVVSYNDTHIDIREFQASGPTFNKIESFTYDNTYSEMTIFNGNDTVVTGNSGYGLGDAKGAIKVYTKANGKWTNTQTITADDLGLRASATLGTSGIFTDAHTLVVTAYTENSVALSNVDSPSGKVVVLTRGANGMWTQAYQLGVDPADTVSFGLGVVMNSRKELLIPGINGNVANSTAYIYATCLTTPINVTCNDMTADCNTVDMSSLYTINSLPACGEINATVVSSTTTNNQMKVEYLFTKLGQSASCISTVTCQAGSPVASTPVKTPSGKKTSSATIIELTSVMLIAMALVM